MISMNRTSHPRRGRFGDDGFGGSDAFAGGGHRGRGGRGGGRPRVFDSGEMRLVLLALITEQPRHGYDLIRAIEARTGGAYAPSPGVVYPTLTLLLDAGLAEEREAAGTRKLVAITDQGRALLVEREADVRVALARLDTLATITEKTDAAPIRRAMQNLKLALHNRLTDEGADKATLLDVAALIDEAASKIERL